MDGAVTMTPWLTSNATEASPIRSASFSPPEPPRVDEESITVGNRYVAGEVLDESDVVEMSQRDGELLRDSEVKADARQRARGPSRQSTDSLFGRHQTIEPLPNGARRRGRRSAGL